MLNHEYYMRKALEQAKIAFKKDEVPVGALVVDANGTILGRGYNLVETRKCQTAHAEMRAIERACKKKSDWRLEGAFLYVTLEPCAMCMNLVLLSRMSGVVFGAASPLFGYHLDSTLVHNLYKKQVTIIDTIEAASSAMLLKQFFKKKREERD